MARGADQRRREKIRQMREELDWLRRRNELLERRALEESWRANPDRSGGAFTEQEKEDAKSWR